MTSNKVLAAKDKLEQAYWEHGLRRRAAKVSGCGRTFRVMQCEGCDRLSVNQEFHCKDRLCPVCAKERSRRLIDRYKGVMKTVRRPRMITLSMRSVPIGHLKEGASELWASWQRLRHQKVFEGVRGAIACMEVTFNRKQQTWHPHLHVLVDSEFITWRMLKHGWVKATRGLGSAVFIQAGHGRFWRELLKYVTKVTSLLDEKRALVEFLRFSNKYRFIRSYGRFYGIETDEELDNLVSVCHECGCQLRVYLTRVPRDVARWCEGKVLNETKGKNASPSGDSFPFRRSLVAPLPVSEQTAARIICADADRERLGLGRRNGTAGVDAKGRVVGARDA